VLFPLLRYEFGLTPGTSPNAEFSVNGPRFARNIKEFLTERVLALVLTSWKKCKLLDALLASLKAFLKLNRLLLKVFCRGEWPIREFRFEETEKEVVPLWC
jgi:hypothetical protein